jgi:hypothetical protein
MIAAPVKSAAPFHRRENLTPVEHPEGTRFNPSTIFRTYGAPIAGCPLRYHRRGPDSGVLQRRINLRYAPTSGAGWDRIAEQTIAVYEKAQGAWRPS